MADKVKLTPPMTDSKTPEWARDQAEDVHIMLVATKDANIETISQALIAAEQSGYERGRKEGIEEAAKVAGAYQATPRLFPHGGSPTENEAAEAGQEFAADEIEYAIRQLLEVKKDIDT